jgi:hypothetical protein
VELPAAVAARLDELIELGARMPTGSESYYADHTSLLSWRGASIALLHRILGPNDAYTKQFEEVTGGYYMSAATTGTVLLRHIRQDLQAGYLSRVSDLIAADVIGDVWAQTSELLDAGYTEAAATLAGAALELGLRRVADKHGIAVDHLRGIGPLNEALAKAGEYSGLRQRQIDVWRQIRNAAAHGDHAAYDAAQVRAMVDGAQVFLGEMLG